MKYEVELKFRLVGVDAVESCLRELGASERPAVSQTDRYYNHPTRDFRVTDEAFRIRSIDHHNCITYKGAVVGEMAKTRHEVEVEFADGADASRKLAEIVGMLGFRFVREVRKTRRSFSVNWSGRDYEIAIDDVPPLGQFLEIELSADEEDRSIAEQAVWQLARKLGLTVPESGTYLQMLLDTDGLPTK